MWSARVSAAHVDHETLVYCRQLDCTFLEFVVWHVDNPKIHSLSLLYSATHSLTRGAPVFVASWTSPPPPDPPPPHFHGHVFEAFSILQGGYHVSFGKECTEIFKTLPNRLTWLDRVSTTGPNPLCTYSAQISHAFVARPTVHARFFNFSLGPTTARRTHASSQILLRIIQHLVTGTSIQSPRQRPIANVRCCAERLRPKGFWHAQMEEHGALGTGEYSNCLFGYTVRPTVVRDLGCSLGCSLVRRARRCRASCQSIIRARCPS